MTAITDPLEFTAQVKRSMKSIATSKPSRAAKKDQLVRLLRSKTGADIATLSRTPGWQPHTTRAALSGLRKAGVEVTKFDAREGRPTRYRIVSPSAPPRSGPADADVPHAG